MSARPRAGSLGSMKADACMKPDFYYGSGSCCPIYPFSSDGLELAWEFMEINRNSWDTATSDAKHLWIILGKSSTLRADNGTN
jgi:hypothetical protein